MRWITDLLNLLYPKICIHCHSALTKNEEIICFSCRSQLPKTNFKDLQSNELTKKFYGIVNLQFAYAYLYFLKSGLTQDLLHQLKYNNKPRIGEIVGNWMGAEIKKWDGIDLDLIVPVPIHAKKERKRGYNQSTYIAKGIEKNLCLPLDSSVLIRKEYNQSQTIMSRDLRWKSVKNAFEVINVESVRGKSILLVDDVVTTGATLEACSRELLNAGAKTISFATLAIAK